MPRRIAPEEIDALLPQTQCGLCGFGGCMPYAEAIIYEQAALNLCPPGGVSTMQALGQLVQEDVSEHIADMQVKAKPPSVAVIREAECIGCTKCIQACPVDAIVGAAKLMHSIVTDECTGCELCITPCPVDCIEMVEINEQKDKREQFRARFNARDERLKKLEKEKKLLANNATLDSKKAYILAALQRKKIKNS